MKGLNQRRTDRKALVNVSKHFFYLQSFYNNTSLSLHRRGGGEEMMLHSLHHRWESIYHWTTSGSDGLGLGGGRNRQDHTEDMV